MGSFIRVSWVWIKGFSGESKKRYWGPFWSVFNSY